MNRGTIAIRNSTVSLLTQILTIVLQFATRSVFIRYLGVELLGLSSTFASLLSTLSLAELGFQSAVVFNLYTPLASHDQDTISKIVSIYRVIYRFIGILFIIASICCLPLLKYVIKGIAVTNLVRCVFLIQAANTASTYFLSYKRSVLYADQQEYLSNLTDAAVNIVGNVIQIVLTVWLRSYVVYLLVRLAQTIAGNLIVHYLCTRKYPYLRRMPVDRQIMKRIVHQVKDIFFGKLAGYVYSSTDSLVISAFVGTVQVGFLNNYVMITSSIRTLANSITGPITPIIGNLLADSQDKQSQRSVFDSYTFVRFLLAGLTAAPIIVLADFFIGMWLGTEYLMSRSVVILLAADLYIHIVHSSCCDYITGSGLFAFDRKVSMLGAGINLVTSVLLVNRLGISGVLIGTVVSQFVFWLCRSYGVFRYCFHAGWQAYLFYWGKHLYYLAVFFAVCIVQESIFTKLPIASSLTRFVVGGVLCEILFLISALLLCGWMSEERSVLSFAAGFIHKLRRSCK